MKIKVNTIPQGYQVKRWGHIGNCEEWWLTSSSAYRTRKAIMRYNNITDNTALLVYEDDNTYTILERI